MEWRFHRIIILAPTVVYRNNIQAGTATVAINGKGCLTGTVTKTFVIDTLPITKCTVSGLSNAFNYTGKSIKPKITVKNGSVTIPSANYTVSFKNNKKIGKATATIKGKGNLSGSIKKTFTIQPKITLKKTRYSKVLG